jgi:uncharacterized membrane protein
MHLQSEIRRRAHGVNVPRDERIVSAIAGAGLGLAGWRRGGLAGLLLGGAGLALLGRGATGRCAVVRTLALGEGVDVHRAITILAPRQEIYAVWRRLENLPRFLEHVTAVTELDERRSHWTVREGPFTLAWDAEIVDDVADRRILWRSLPGSRVDHAGYVELSDAPAGRGTEVHVGLRYRPPGGALVTAPLRGLLRRLARHQLDAELRRLRQLVETGEIATGAHHRGARSAAEERFAVAAAAAPAGLAAPTPARRPRGTPTSHLPRGGA